MEGVLINDVLTDHFGKGKVAEIPPGLAQGQHHLVGFGKAVRISHQPLRRENREIIRVCYDDIGGHFSGFPRLKFFICSGDNDIGRPGVEKSNGGQAAQFRPQRLCSRIWYVGDRVRVPEAATKNRRHPVDPIRVRLTFIKTEFETGHQEDDQAGKDAQTKTQHMNKGDGGSPDQVPPGDFHVVAQHEVVV